MYWLTFSTLFWLWAFGDYPTKAECLEAAEQAPWYVSAKCVRQPAPQNHDHQH